MFLEHPAFATTGGVGRGSNHAIPNGVNQKMGLGLFGGNGTIFSQGQS